MSEQHNPLARWMRQMGLLPKAELSDHGKFLPDAVCEALGNAALDKVIAQQTAEFDALQKNSPDDRRLPDMSYYIGHLKGINSLDVTREEALKQLDEATVSTILKQHLPDLAETVQQFGGKAVAGDLPQCEGQVVVPLAIREIKARFGYDKSLPVCDMNEAREPMPGVVQGKPAQCNER